jgi:hypothetical protein
MTSEKLVSVLCEACPLRDTGLWDVLHGYQLKAMHIFRKRGSARFSGDFTQVQWQRAHPSGLDSLRSVGSVEAMRSVLVAVQQPTAPERKFLMMRSSTPHTLIAPMPLRRLAPLAKAVKASPMCGSLRGGGTHALWPRACG